MRKFTLNSIQLMVLAVGVMFSSISSAHPVSYQGSTSVMTWNQPYLTDIWTTYSFRNDAAVALRTMRMQMSDGEMRVYLAQMDYLAKRWNELSYQGNVYVYGGYGAAHFQSQTGGVGMAGIEADIESRKYFLMGQYEGMYPTVGPQFQHLEARVGIAPYEAEYEEVASWLMLQAQYHPALTKNYAITPLARFFYKNVLWETGVSLDGDWLLNFMFHF
jgi:hypothetical protein